MRCTVLLLVSAGREGLTLHLSYMCSRYIRYSLFFKIFFLKWKTQHNYLSPCQENAFALHNKARFTLWLVGCTGKPQRPG